MSTIRRLGIAAAFASVIAAFACGGSSSSPVTPGNNTTLPPASPCSTVSLDAPVPAVTSAALPSPKSAGTTLDHHSRRPAQEALWRHQEAIARGVQRSALAAQASAQDVGEIAVIQDQGDVITPAHPIDLKGVGLTYRPAAGGGYNVVAGPTSFQTSLGTRLTLSDDDTSQMTLSFAVPFYGKSETAGFVNSDGNITFEQGDNASTDRDISRLASGPPRVAPFFADLDPSKGGGVFVNANATAVTVTWCKVPGYGSTSTLTAQVTIWPDGHIDSLIDPGTTLTDAVVGISPGNTTTFSPVNLASATSSTVSGGTGAFGERYSAKDEIDLVALSQKFYGSHPDGYDQLLVWTDRNLVYDAFAYEMTVANEIQGIGVDLYDLSKSYGSAGGLRSVVMMDDIHKYPADPTVKFNGENNSLSLMGQESGHRWLAFMTFLDVNRQVSDVWLGRDKAHWSFFMNSDASVMEGNQIQDLGGGAFKTTAAVQRYSKFDQYAMGLLAPTDVPPTFYVDSPKNIVPVVTSVSAPRVGVTFNGTRRDVLIDDVIGALGPRVPAAAQSSRVHRQAFIYLVSAGQTMDPVDRGQAGPVQAGVGGFLQPGHRRADAGRDQVEAITARLATGGWRLAGTPVHAGWRRLRTCGASAPRGGRRHVGRRVCRVRVAGARLRTTDVRGRGTTLCTAVG